MPITTTFRIPAIGLETDYENVSHVEQDVQYQEYDYGMMLSSLVDRSTTTITFKDGTKLTLGAITEGQIVKTVELVEGRIYQVSQGGGNKWLALCKYDAIDDEIVLVPITHNTDSHTFSGDDKAAYQFHKEFDLDLKEYL